MPAEYGVSSYWNERYSALLSQSEEGEADFHYEWYQDWASLRALIQPLLKPNDANFEVLVPGCGSSAIGANIYREGCKNVTCIDSSAVVINQMSDKYSSLEEMEFTVMDATDMEYIPDMTFDLVVDKALFDCQLCSDSNFVKVTNLVSEIYRVLKPGGTYVMISHGKPESRHGFLTMSEDGESKLDWSIVTKKISKARIEGKDGDDEYHYVFVASKTK